MEGIIASVKKHSLAEEAGIRAGEHLYKVNGRPVSDIIDLSYAASAYDVTLQVGTPEQGLRNVRILKDPDEDLGLAFEAAVFDQVRRCQNKCRFCFVDQMIPGMRKGLYVRDDDYRLSFLYGNFITLTNLTEADFERIATLHLSPLYVSIHATDPETRITMMHNKAADQIMPRLQRLFRHDIHVHTQIVCCPGYNNGKILEKSFRDLVALHPHVETMAVVPVGLTKNRAHLPKMRPFSKEEACELVEMVSGWQEECRSRFGTSFIYLGDEFYILAGKPFPPEAWYDGFPQLENGIGLSRSFLVDWAKAAQHSRQPSHQDSYVLPVGESAAGVLQPLLDAFNARFATRHELLAVPNVFFGPLVNVTGLLTGSDLLAALPKDKDIILPAVVLNNDQLFLDDMSLAAFKQSCGRHVEVVKDATELYAYLTR